MEFFMQKWSLFLWKAMKWPHEPFWMAYITRAQEWLDPFLHMDAIWHQRVIELHAVAWRVEAVRHFPKSDCLCQFTGPVQSTMKGV